VQVKDALLADGWVVVAGAGDGEMVEIVRALRDAARRVLLPGAAFW